MGPRSGFTPDRGPICYAGYRTFGVVFIPDFGWCGGRNWGFELVCFNCEVGQDVKRPGFCSYLFLRGLEHAEEVFTRV